MEVFWGEGGVDPDEEGGVQVGHLVLAVEGGGEAGHGGCQLGYVGYAQYYAVLVHYILTYLYSIMSLSSICSTPTTPWVLLRDITWSMVLVERE